MNEYTMVENPPSTFEAHAHTLCNEHVLSKRTHLNSKDHTHKHTLRETEREENSTVGYHVEG